MEREILLSGIGGQGVQLAARMLATAAMDEGRHVLMFGTYGGVMRGGDTDATVVVGDAPLLTPPVVDHAWAVMAMHHMSWKTLGAKLRPDGFLLTDSDVFQAGIDHPGPALAIPAIAMATENGMPQAGSMVALGALAAATGIVALETLVGIAEEVLPPYRRQFAEANRRALAIGHGAVAARISSAWPLAEAAL